MKYVEEVLQPGEKVLFVSTIHWLIYLPGAALLLAGLGLWFGTLNGESNHPILWAGALLLLAGGLLSVARPGSGAGPPRSPSPTGASS